RVLFRSIDRRYPPTPIKTCRDGLRLTFDKYPAEFRYQLGACVQQESHDDLRLIHGRPHGSAMWFLKKCQDLRSFDITPLRTKNLAVGKTSTRAGMTSRTDLINFN